MAARHSLDERILAVFKRACAEDRMDVAEHLLRALETLDGDPKPNTPLGKAYLTVAAAERCRKRVRQTH
jgi:hypothetical protein